MMLGDDVKPTCSLLMLLPSKELALPYRSEQLQTQTVTVQRLASQATLEQRAQEVTLTHPAVIEDVTNEFCDIDQCQLILHTQQPLARLWVAFTEVSNLQTPGYSDDIDPEGPRPGNGKTTKIKA